MNMFDEDFILVVDDDDDIRESLATLLEDEGHKVISACNGQEALAILQRSGLPCVILLDLMMPVMDGAEFRKHQLADAKLAEIPVVLITAAGQARARAVPSNRVLPKPLKAEDLFAAVDTFCMHAD